MLSLARLTQIRDDLDPDGFPKPRSVELFGVSVSQTSALLICAVMCFRKAFLRLRLLASGGWSIQRSWASERSLISPPVVNRLTGGDSGAPDHPHSGSIRIQGAAAAATVSGRLTNCGVTTRATGPTVPVPSSVEACNKSLLGAMPFTNPAGAAKWLLGLEGGFCSSQASSCCTTGYCISAV